ncbi:DODA-type extradiol aromatic ring-opening family dioxygenase [Alteromonas gilva]|uniref:Class III extradiol ring-cleavage dioxygenase n=1 Tax=Alteromonas gilva TaxID=2987522 RepID=A0ABT5L571_9ALTE|nr:class III extradiol ring-cleavage dioxygenase [Alteromonas gilva]MDC8831007.1 class III extradiol ring-cleavage dioxygenase [Alteromonas gilva]
MNNSQQAVFISHGGGPMPLLGDPGHQGLVEHLNALSKRLRRPSAILVISAHWEAAVATVTSNPAPPLLYDYYGFPPQSYKITYPCPGEPALAASVASALQSAGIKVNTDDERGLDHGVFVPLKLMYPDADIPVVQLSLLNSLDASLHIQLGQAIGALEYDNLLILGSGFSFHNMRAFFAPDTAVSREHNVAFESWFKNVMTAQDISEESRSDQLCNWEQAPGARFCHPREEHLLPLHVCYGAAGRAADIVESVVVLNKQAGTFGWL